MLFYKIFNPEFVTAAKQLIEYSFKKTQAAGRRGFQCKHSLKKKKMVPLQIRSKALPSFGLSLRLYGHHVAIFIFTLTFSSFSTALEAPQDRFLLSIALEVLQDQFLPPPMRRSLCAEFSVEGVIAVFCQAGKDSRGHLEHNSHNSEQHTPEAQTQRRKSERYMYPKKQQHILLTRFGATHTLTGQKERIETTHTSCTNWPPGLPSGGGGEARKRVRMREIVRESKR